MKDKYVFELILLWLSLFLGHGLYAQQTGTVSGRVISAKDGQPLIGVSLGLKEKAQGAQTNAEGQFTLQATPGDVLVVSYIGFETQEIAVENGMDNLTISLQPATTNLDEVVVVGYGTQKKSSLTASVASISPEEVQKQVTGNVASALQGRAPGVEVVNQGGIAGADVNIVIRGAASFGSTEPLVVIDGAFSNTGLSSLNPQDIESIEVLKDAAAAAIYGSRAANGVVLVTTKKGVKGAPVIEIDASYSVQSPTKKLDFLNASQWRQFANQVADNSGMAHAPENDQPSDPSLDTDWQDLFFQYAPIYNANVGISGGGENTTYHASLGYFDQTGMTVTSSFKRYNARINTSYRKNRLTVSENLAIAFKHTTPTPVFVMPLPTLPAFDAEGNFYSGGPDYYLGGNENRRSNPLALPNYRNAFNNNIDVLGGLQLGYELFKGLEYKFNFSGSLNNFHDYSHTPQFYTRFLEDGSPDTDYGNNVNSLSETRGNEFNYNIDNLLAYNNQFGKHHVDFLLGTSWLREYYRYASISSIADLGGENITGVNGEGQIAAGENNAALLSFFTRANYDYDNKYLFSASIRRDESSKFHKDSRVGWFPSVSAGWNIHNEEFFKSGLISNLKVRASYGELGANFIDPYGFNALAYGPIPAVFGTSQSRAFGRVAYFADKNLKWETSVSKDLGLEVGLLDNRLTFTMDYFIKTNEDLLAGLELTPSSGQTIVINQGFRPVVNAASVENKGFEFMAAYKQAVREDFYFDASFNISFIKNKVLELGQNVQPIRGELISGSFNDRPTITDKGLPIGSFIGYRILGIDNEGDFIFEDNNGLGGDGSLTGQPDGNVDDNDKVILGNPIPDFTYGLNLSTNYKQFDVTLFVQGVYGNEIFNQRRYTNYFNYDNNVIADVLNAWTPTNTDTNIPRMTIANFYGGNALPSSFYIEDGSYLRLKNFQIGYSFAPGFVSKRKLSRMRVYAGVQNLFTITNYSGYDPEVSSNVLFNRGVDFNAYPNARLVTAGLSMSF